MFGAMPIRNSPSSILPLVPASSIEGRALVVVIAIMTFLATLTVGGALLVSEASKGWSNRISQEATIQIKPQSGRDIEVDLKNAAEIATGFPGVDQVRILSRKESADLLEPWLGGNIQIQDLPIPRLIVVKPMAPSFSAEGLASALKERLPIAYLDNHKFWNDRLNVMANTLVTFALVVLFLIVVAMILVIAFATRGAMAGTRDIVDVLHFVGAKDSFIANEFLKHFLRIGLRGALIGGFGSLGLLALSRSISVRSTTGSELIQLEALFGTFTLGWTGTAIMVGIMMSVAILVGCISRTIVIRHLRGLR